MSNIREASEMLGLPEQSLRIAIQRGAFPQFATCWKNKKHYQYYINMGLLKKYLEGSRQWNI